VPSGWAARKWEHDVLSRHCGRRCFGLMVSSELRSSSEIARRPWRSSAGSKTGTSGLRRFEQIRSEASHNTISAARTLASYRRPTRRVGVTWRSPAASSRIACFRRSLVLAASFVSVPDRHHQLCSRRQADPPRHPPPRGSGGQFSMSPDTRSPRHETFRPRSTTRRRSPRLT
jgi:hypothetical protein